MHEGFHGSFSLNTFKNLWVVVPGSLGWLLEIRKTCYVYILTFSFRVAAFCSVIDCWLL